MYVAHNRLEDTAVNLLVWAAVIGAGLLCFRRWRPARTACGTAAWMIDKLLRAWGMLGRRGLILGRTLRGSLIRMPRYCHILLVGSTGSGKGVSIIIPNILDYFRGSLVVFDTKGDLFLTTAERRQRQGQRIVRLAPFSGDGDRMNSFDTIPADSPLLTDSARAMAEALVVREGTEPDPYWNAKAVQVITAILVLVLRRLAGAERSLNSVQDIASDPAMLASAADRLREMGGIPARLGNQIKMLFEKGTTLTKEGAGVMSTVARHLSFLDSEMVARSVANSTFDVHSLLEPGVTLYLTIPPEHLEAQKGLLRCWISTLIRVIGSSGREESSEVLFLLDEASALGSLSAVEEALVRGRSAGVRMLLAYQSDSQVQTAFKDKPTLLYDNCSTQIYLGASSYETAERISKNCGDRTEVVDSYGVNAGNSRSTDGPPGGQVSSGKSMNYAQQGRPLLRPEEVLTLGEDYLIAFLRGLPGPVLAKRVKWYEDAAFNQARAVRRKKQPVLLCVLVVLLIALGVVVIRAKVNGYGYWQRENVKEVIDGKDR